MLNHIYILMPLTSLGKCRATLYIYIYIYVYVCACNTQHVNNMYVFRKCDLGWPSFLRVFCNGFC